MAAKRSKPVEEPVRIPSIQPLLDWYQNVLRPITRERGDVESEIAATLGMELLSIAWRGTKDKDGNEGGEAALVRKLYEVRAKLAAYSSRDRHTRIRERVLTAFRWYALGEGVSFNKEELGKGVPSQVTTRAKKAPADFVTSLVLADLRDWFKLDAELVAVLDKDETTKAAKLLIRAMRANDDTELGRAGKRFLELIGVGGDWSTIKRTKSRRRNRAAK